MKVPLFQGILRHTTPHFMAYFGVIVFANMGGGGGQNYFHYCAGSRSGQDPSCRPCSEIRASPNNYERKRNGCNSLLTFSLGQRSCRPKVPRIFKNLVPNFAPNFAPNFSRIFRGFFVLRFVGDGDQKKFTKNPRHFSMQNSQANTEKIFTKRFWRAGKVTFPY